MGSLDAVARRALTMPTLREMFGRLVVADGQTRAARSVEGFGWIQLVLGTLILNAPRLAASLLRLPALDAQAQNYSRLVGLLVCGLGLLYIASGRLSSTEFAFASMIDRPLVPFVMAVLVWKGILPLPLGIAFSISDFGSFLWTLSAWRLDERRGPPADRRNWFTRLIDAGFRFTSGVVRNARTFHPDGRTFRASVRSLDPVDPALARAAARLAGGALVRVGMGVMKRGMPAWLADHIPDAPSMALRIFTRRTGDEVTLERTPGDDLDLLCTAGGDRLWKLLLNLSTGGLMYGLHQFDYFENVYYADVPYRTEDGSLDVWVRLVPAVDQSALTPIAPGDGVSREARLTNAVSIGAAMRIEVQHAGRRSAPFVPIAEMRFDAEIDIDQEALHFDPVQGRGFVPHGALTVLRRSVYPASVLGRAASRDERAQREHEGVAKRLARYFRG
jgi:hypothetical protein